jgi:hypothetical protein
VRHQVREHASCNVVQCSGRFVQCRCDPNVVQESNDELRRRGSESTESSGSQRRCSSLRTPRTSGQMGSPTWTVVGVYDGTWRTVPRSAARATVSTVSYRISAPTPGPGRHYELVACSGGVTPQHIMVPCSAITD